MLKKYLQFNPVSLQQSRQKSFIIFISRVGYFCLPLTADAMASAGINCCSTVSQHKCI